MEPKDNSPALWIIAPANGRAVTIDPSGRDKAADHDGQSAMVADIKDLNLQGVDPRLKCGTVGKCEEVVINCPSVTFRPCEVLIECTNVTRV